MKLDALDIKIITILQKNSHITKSALAASVGLSASPCWERVKRLEKGGIIKGYQAKIDTHKIVKHATFFVQIYLKSHTKSDWKAFEEAIADIPEVTECYVISGSVDYILKIIVADVEEYQSLLDSLLEKNIGIDRYNGHIITRCITQNNGADISHLLKKNGA